MSFSYDETLPGDKDLVRLLLGDTYDQEQVYSDEEIQAVLDRASSPYDAVPLFLLGIANSPDKLDQYMRQASGALDMVEFAELLYEEAMSWSIEIG